MYENIEMNSALQSEDVAAMKSKELKNWPE